MPLFEHPLVEISGVTVAATDVDATREAWCRLAGATDTPALVVGGLALGVAPTMGGDEGVVAVTLACEDVVSTTRLLQRRGLRVDDTEIDVAGLTWRLTGLTGPVVVEDAGDLLGLDHVVVSTSEPERALALYGARLGLDLRLDQAMPQYRMRGQFYRCGDAVVEVVTRLDDEGAPTGEAGADDTFAGFAWRVADLEATRARLLGTEVEVSEIRAGRKPGTRVATVKDPDLTVPTLLVEPS